MTTPSSIQQLFANYADAFNKLDVQAEVRAFADNFVMAGPNGVISLTKAEFTKNAEQAASFYKSVGMNSAKMLDMKVSPISVGYTIVTIHWGVTFKKTGDKMEAFDVSYIVNTTSATPEIIMEIAHQDEGAAMERLQQLQDK